MSPIICCVSLFCTIGMCICYARMVMMRNEAAGKLTRAINTMMEARTTLNHGQCHNCDIAHRKLNEAIEELKE